MKKRKPRSKNTSTREERPPKDRQFILLRIFNEDRWGSKAKCEIVAQGTKKRFLELYPPEEDSPGMQLWLELLLSPGRGTYCFFEERFDCRPGNWDECGDPRFIE